jgi:hypothetical protein
MVKLLDSRFSDDQITVLEIGLTTLKANKTILAQKIPKNAARRDRQVVINSLLKRRQVKPGIRRRKLKRAMFESAAGPVT